MCLSALSLLNYEANGKILTTFDNRSACQTITLCFRIHIRYTAWHTPAALRREKNEPLSVQKILEMEKMGSWTCWENKRMKMKLWNLGDGFKNLHCTLNLYLNEINKNHLKISSSFKCFKFNSIKINWMQLNEMELYNVYGCSSDG